MLNHEQIKEILSTVKQSSITEDTGLTRQAIYNLKKNFKPSYDTMVKLSKSYEYSWPMYEWVKENNDISSPFQAVASDMANTWYLFGEFRRKPSSYSSMCVSLYDEETIDKIDSLWVES